MTMNNGIILYTQDGCPQCRMVHMLLDKKGIKYTECKDLEKMKELGINHTPVLEIAEGTRILGKAIFDWVNKQ